MLIKSSKAGVSGTLVRPAPPPPSPPPPDEPDVADDPLLALHGRAGWLAALVYGSSDGLEALLAGLGATDFASISDDGLSTVGCGFVLDGRAWLVFRGSDDRNDWVRNLFCVPFYHIGFKLCFADIRPKLDQWRAKVASKDRTFCIVGHSLGGAIAALAARYLAREKHPVEMLCTFGAPRVFAPWMAWLFNRQAANLPGQPDRKLIDVTHRFVDRYELVCHTPPFLAGFKHVGRRIGCEDAREPAEAPAAPVADGRWEDAKYALTQTFQAPVVGPWLALLAELRRGVDRAARAGPAHNMELYAGRVDTKGRYKFSEDQIERVGESAPARVRTSSKLIVGGLILAGIILAIALALAAVYGLGLLLWNAPWKTLGSFVVFAGVIFIHNYKQRRDERRLYPYATGPAAFGLRSGTWSGPPLTPR